MQKGEQILSKRAVAERLDVSPPTVDRREHEDPAFPRRRQLGPGRVGWLASELDSYILALPVGALTERTAAARAARRHGGERAASR